MRNSTLHTITKEKYDELMVGATPGITILDDSGLLDHATKDVKGCAVTILHNLTDESYILVVPRGSYAQKARQACGVL